MFSQQFIEQPATPAGVKAMGDLFSNSNPQGELAYPLPLTEEFRPRVLADLIGLERIKRVLGNLVKAPRCCAILACGAPGTGKSASAMAFAQELGAETHRISSQECKLETLQNAIAMCHRVAFNFQTGKPATWHLVTIEECETISSASQLYLLSKLDSTDFPPQTIFFFTCNSVEALSERFLSRCLKLDYNSYGSSAEIAALLEKVWAFKAPNTAAPNLKKLVCGNVRESLQRLEIALLEA
jgi:replication-associated recombination protein RarA